MLSIEEIYNAHERRRSKRDSLAAMKSHQNWVRMHADTALSGYRSTESMASFQSMVKSLIPDYKYSVFMKLLRFPLPTTAVVSVVFDRLSRIFEGRNPVYNYQFESLEIADDWEWYRQEMLDEPNVWKTKAWEYFRTEPNSVLVVDMPEKWKGGEDKYLQPYFYFVTVDDIIDYCTDDSGRIEWIIYRNRDSRRIYAIDDRYYRSFKYDDASGEIIQDEDYVENEHTLGYCPAMFFIDTPVSLSQPDVKKSPITDVLSELDWYLFAATSKKHLDAYGAYPIYSGYEAACNWEEELTYQEKKIFRHCEGGIVCDDHGAPVIDPVTHEKMKCPKCGKSRIVGAGSYVEVPAPVEGVADMRNPIQILSVDWRSLNYNTNELERKKKEIIATCVGVDGERTLSEFSVSDKQVDANYESQSTILVRVKKVFENAQWFVDSTICKLRYGGQFVSASIDYGTDFYMMTTEQMRKRYADAKEGGASEADLDALRRQVIETEYRSNPLQMQRMLILNDVEPLVSMSVADAKDAYSMGLIDESDMKVKANFSSLIRRFERENGNIIDFGVSMPYVEKIETIKNTLNDYVRSIKTRISKAE